MHFFQKKINNLFQFYFLSKILVEFDGMSSSGVATSSSSSSSSTSSSSSIETAAIETAAIDSGVDSEVSPSSPDSCKKTSDEEEIMATAETLLALSGKAPLQSSDSVEEESKETQGKD